MTATRYGLIPGALAMAVLLAACGGGGGGTTTASTDTGSGSPPVVQQQDLPVTVIDGPIQGAVVCLDKNANGLCDSGEPTGTTDANGKVTLKIDPADAGKYTVLALVGTDAVDQLTGKVRVGFVLKAPADQPAVVSPITTLVQATIDTTGAKTSDAAAAVQQQLGITSSPFVDYTQDKTGDAPLLAQVAPLVVATTQQQIQALAPAVNTTAVDGKAITQQDIVNAVTQAVLQALPQVVGALADPANQGKSASDIATDLVHNATLGLDTNTIAAAVAVDRSRDTSADTATAGGNMVTLNYTDANNWSRRLITVSAAEAAPDSTGHTRWLDRRSRAANGAIANWSFGGDPTRQNDFHWDGQAWVQCPLLQEGTNSVRDAQGRSSYNYCDNLDVGGNVRSTIDIEGRSMQDVYQQILTGGYTNVTIANPGTALGTATFPKDSKLYLHVNTSLATALAYVPNLSSQVRNSRADLASGDPTACSQVLASTPVATYTTLATTLESMIAANQGTPCVFQSGSDRNEAWSHTTLSVGTVGNAPTGGTQTAPYTTNTLLRVAFGPNNVAKYYSCLQRASDGSVRNCDSIGTGTYTISTLGDGRALTFQNQPAQFSMLAYQRVFVERGGQVHFGYQNRLGTTSTARLNLTASNALFTQLGLPAVDPETPPALTLASYQGDWIVGDQTPLENTIGTVIRIPGNGGATTCIDNEQGQSFACTLTLDPASGNFTYTASDGSATGNFSFNTGTGGGTFTPTSGSPVTFTGARR